jgi:hypothetical protein
VHRQRFLSGDLGDPFKPQVRSRKKLRRASLSLPASSLQLNQIFPANELRPFGENSNFAGRLGLCW